jgi:hypothetical protein
MSYSKYTFSLLLLFLFAIFILEGCGRSKDRTMTNQATLFIKSPVKTERLNEPVVIGRKQIYALFRGMSRQKRIIVRSTEGKAIPCQFDDINNDGLWDEMVFLVNIPASGFVKLLLEKADIDTYPVFPSKTNISFFRKISGTEELTEIKKKTMENKHPFDWVNPYVFEGIVWENENIAFRLLLDGSNSVGIIGKEKGHFLSKKNAESYGHELVKIGNSTGAGGIVMYHKGKPVRLGVGTEEPFDNIDSVKFEFVTEGPVRAVFRYTCYGWKVKPHPVDIQQTIIIWAGTYAYQNRLIISGHKRKEILGVGYSNINNDRPLLKKEYPPNVVAMIAHDRQTQDKKEYLGMAVLLPKDHFIDTDVAHDARQHGITGSYIARFNATYDKPIQYHFIAGWEGNNKKFKILDEYLKYVENEAKKMNNPVKLFLENP